MIASERRPSHITTAHYTALYMGQDSRASRPGPTYPKLVPKLANWSSLYFDHQVISGRFPVTPSLRVRPQPPVGALAGEDALEVPQSSARPSVLIRDKGFKRCEAHIDVIRLDGDILVPMAGGSTAKVEKKQNMPT